MIHITDEKNCCGCGACAAVCPKKCIQMKPGTLGAVFPEVDTASCINCGLCEQVCPLIHVVQVQRDSQTAYAAIARDDKMRYDGSSGGVFGVLAKGILQENGIVYGAAFNKQLKLKCTKAETIDELKPLYKSKYLQSDLVDAFREIKEYLKTGRKVLFVSTPCQNAALKRYLKKDYENLMMVDFFCHGVPSQKFFDECIAYLDAKEGMETYDYEFRTKKSNGVTPHYFTKKSRKKGKEICKVGYYFESPYYAAFQQYVTLRESCYSCQYSNRNRVTDITIGDFHEIDQYVSGINRFDGVSTVIVNTERGAQYLEKVKNEMTLYPMDMEKLIADGTVFAGSTKRPSHRDAFVQCYEDSGISGLMRTYLNRKRYLKNWIYYSMPDVVRKLLKKAI